MPIISFSPYFARLLPISLVLDVFRPAPCACPPFIITNICRSSFAYLVPPQKLFSITPSKVCLGTLYHIPTHLPYSVPFPFSCSRQKKRNPTKSGYADETRRHGLKRKVVYCFNIAVWQGSTSFAWFGKLVILKRQHVSFKDRSHFSRTTRQAFGIKLSPCLSVLYSSLASWAHPPPPRSPRSVSHPSRST